MMKPTAKQMEFLSWELGLFFHFGIRTFYEGHTDWDMKPMPLEGFNPSELDCDNWIKAAVDGGAKYAILVTKHHDGFANWPTKYSDYSVANTPWKDGKGDVVREFVDSCRKFNIKVGLYYSPADFSVREEGSKKDFDQFFIDQVSELLTNYGTIDYLWFDGCGSEGHSFDKQRIINHIRSLQKDILIFNMWDPDTRWIGNEAGVLPGWETNFCDISTLCPPATDETVYRWLPAECDCMIRNNAWFYTDSNAQHLQTVDQLMGLYYYSIGRGANLLVNIGPDRRGLLPEIDIARFIEFREERERRFSNKVADISRFVRNGSTYTLKFDKPTYINNIFLSEDITNAERIRSYVIKCNLLGSMMPINLWKGEIVGYNQACYFPTIRAEEIIIEILEAEPEYEIIKADVFYVEG